MAIRLYEGRMEFDYDSSDGSVKTTHTVYIESDGLYFDGTIYGSGSPGVIISSPVSSNSSGLSTGDFEFQVDQIAFGTNTLFAKSDGSGVVFSGTIGATLDSVEGTQLGTVAGFTSGGRGAPSAKVTTIDKFPFSISGGTATDVGDLLNQTSAHAGQSSSTDGFYSGTVPAGTTIGKFPFAISSGTGTEVGNVNTAKSFMAGHSSNDNGFASGGQTAPGSSSNTTDIEKFPFAISSGTATDVGDLSALTTRHSGQSSSTNGFKAGGGPPNISTIDKFPFSISGGTATDVGDLPAVRNNVAGVSSHNNGYAINGQPFVDDIMMFPFAISSGTATDVGNLTLACSLSTGVSGMDNGFKAGGINPGLTPTRNNVIDKFPYSITSGTATDAGDLTEVRNQLAGHQD